MMAQQVGERGGLDGQGDLRGGGGSAGDSVMGREGAMNSKEKTTQAQQVKVRAEWGKWPKTKTGSLSLERIRRRIPHYLALCLRRGEAFGSGSLFGA